MGVVERVPLARHRRRLGDRPAPAIEAALAAARAPCCCATRTIPTGTVHSRESLARTGRDRRRGSARPSSATRSMRRSRSRARVHARSWRVTPPRRASATPSRARARPTTSPASNAPLMVAGGRRARPRCCAPCPIEVEWRTGLFGAARRRRRVLARERRVARQPARRARREPPAAAELLAEHLPERALPASGRRIPGVGRPDRVGWGDNPRRRILREAKVALHHGPAVRDGGHRARAHQLRMLARAADRGRPSAWARSPHRDGAARADARDGSTRPARLRRASGTPRYVWVTVGAVALIFLAAIAVPRGDDGHADRERRPRRRRALRGRLRRDAGHERDRNGRGRRVERSLRSPRPTVRGGRALRRSDS